MEIIVLGSGTGTPSLTRNAAGLIIKIENENLLFDTGPGMIKKLLELGITYHDIDYIFYTHFHTDHTLDLATFLFAAKYALSLRTKKLDIIGPCGLERFYYSLLSLYGDVITPCAYEVILRDDYLLQNMEINSGTIIDLGANIGIFSTFVAKKAKGIKVYSYEPEPENFEFFCLNISSTRYSISIFCLIPKKVLSLARL